jgi:hypothetical protein
MEGQPRGKRPVAWKTAHARYAIYFDRPKEREGEFA